MYSYVCMYACMYAAAQSSSDKFAIFLPIYSSNFQKNLAMVVTLFFTVLAKSISVCS